MNQSTHDFSELPKEELKLLCQLQFKHRISKEYHRQYFGNTPSVNEFHGYDRMLVSVRGNIYQSSDPYIDWETPGDFLVSYLKSSFGDFWPENDLIAEIRA